MKRAWWVLAAAIPLVLIGSATVWRVAGGDERRLGAITAASDPVMLAWRGQWVVDAIYQPGQVVAYDGSSYVAQVENKGMKPGNAEWVLMASKGAPGSAGPAGPPGPSGAYSTASPWQSLVTASYTSIASLSLPAGSYAVTARVEMDNRADDGGGVQIDCRLRSGTANLDTTSFILNARPPGYPTNVLRSDGHFVLAGSLSLGTAGNVQVQCSKGFQATEARVPRLMAMKVDQVTVSP